jgi:hypothetical protein
LEKAMIDATLSVIETLLTADGISPSTIDTVRSVIRNDGMVSTRQARKALNVTGQKVRRLCERHAIRREPRNGSGGSLVDLKALLLVVAG